MLWQRTGGLQVQLLQTVRHLQESGVEARVINPLKDKFEEFDVIHVFSATHGMHLVLEEAKRQGKKTVLSPVFQPDVKLAKFKRFRAASWITARLSQYEIKTTHDYITSSLHHADRIIALSDKEHRIISDGYEIDKNKIHTIPNGIDNAFLTVDRLPWSRPNGIEKGFVLIVGSISAYKNQLRVIQATRRNVVLIGPIQNSEYFDECLAAGNGRVWHLGSLNHDDELLRSAYAHAAVTVLASEGEAFGLTVVESLASGTPAVITSKNGLGLRPIAPCLQFVDSHNPSEISTAIEVACNATVIERQQCKTMVEHLSWSRVTQALIPVYKQLYALA